MSKIIGILSGKGGVGKTSLVANLGAAMTEEFKRDVVIIDANLTSSHLGLHLGIYEDLPVTMREVVRKNTSVDYALYVHPVTGIKIVPASLSGDGIEMSSSKFVDITRKLSQDHDIIIVDCPPGLGKEVVTAVSAIDSAVVITTPDFPAVADALKTVRLLERMRKHVIGIVVNKRKGEKYELTAQEIESTCGVPVVGTIPDDVKVSEGVSEGIPVVFLFPYTKSSRAFKVLAGRLIGEEYRPKNILVQLGGMFSRRKVPSQDPVRRMEENSMRRDAVMAAAPEVERDGGDSTDVIADRLRSQIYDQLREEVVRKVKERLAQERENNKSDRGA